MHRRVEGALRVSIFKVELTLWVDDSVPYVRVGDYIDVAVTTDSQILDWEETPMRLVPLEEDDD